MSNLEYSAVDRAYLEANDIRFPEFSFFPEKKPASKAEKKQYKLLRSFKDKTLDGDLQRTLQELQLEDSTPIQAVSINPIIEGRDLIGISKTGSGKTLAFSLPMVVRYNNQYDQFESNKDRKVVKPKVLVLAPTRELALQVNETIRSISLESMSSYCVYGGTDRIQQIRSLENIRPLIIVATPGRFKDFLDNKIFSVDEVEMLVLDEADRMLDKGFYPDVEYILKFLPKKRQILLFSATWNEELHEIVKEHMNIENLFKVSIGSVCNEVNKDILQIPVVLGDFQKLYFLSELIGKIFCGFKILVFFNRTDTVNRMTEHFQGEKIAPVQSFSSEVPQDQREYLIKRFREGKIKILFATDAVSRGLDIDDIHLVINYDFPATLDTYIHRIGRTARNGKYGQAISFLPAAYRANKNFPHLMNILEHGTSEIPPEFAKHSDSDSE